MDKLDLLLLAYKRKKKNLRRSVLTQLEQFCSGLLDLDKKDTLTRKDVLTLSKGYKEFVREIEYKKSNGILDDN